MDLPRSLFAFYAYLIKREKTLPTASETREKRWRAHSPLPS